ncbi:hypothetical protein PHLGIDRAFT_151480 [Phlebiopsis gigantea 11061_1 CR5-6]|uniref:Uncharacterized protein n=1 Tax=Phlebiopsis gigantea (strain 11061_1 CR5-6) TaxID=745531 RepID=A0A0C3S590_PHLG1|nr:hypothetical protein PHLGIDRAFT_151480 [Phlebiopsis gigantea 11061_1 CR5-6]
MGLTWKKTFREYMVSRQMKLTTPVTTCLLRDGTWYFFALLIFNTLSMFYVFDPSFVILDPFVSFLPPVLVNRFMINLRSPTAFTESRGITSSFHPSISSNVHRPSTLRFLGNIGESLEHGQEDQDGSVEDAELEDSLIAGPSNTVYEASLPLKARTNEPPAEEQPEEPNAPALLEAVTIEITH